MTAKTQPLPASESLFESTEEPVSTALVEHEVTPLDQFAALVANGLSPEQGREFVTLYKEMRDDAAKQAYTKAMHACQLEMPTIVRDAQNPQTRSKFALLETIQKQAKPIYGKHGFAISFGEADCPLAGHKRTTCDVSHAAGHIRSFHLDLPTDGIGAKGNAIGGMNAVQGSISTTSYGQRRLLCMIFNITIADEDDDGQSSGAKISQEQYALLHELIEETKADKAKFLAWLGVDNLGDTPASDFEKAYQALKRKQAR